MRSARALLLYTVALWTVIVMFLLTLDAINRLDIQQGDTDSSDALDIGHEKPPGQYVVTLKTILGNDAYALFEKSITGTSTSAPPTTPKHGEETAKPDAPLAKLLGKSKETLTTLAKPNQEKAASKAPTIVKHGKEAFTTLAKPTKENAPSKSPTIVKHGKTADLAARLGKMLGKSKETLTTLAKPNQENAASEAKLVKIWSSNEILPMLFKSSHALPIRTPPTHAKLDNASGSTRVKRSSESYVDWFYRVVWTKFKGKQTMG